MTSSKIQHDFSDIPSGGWVDRSVPEVFRPYLRLARLDRPIGIWLLLFPCWWSLSLAAAQSRHWPDVELILLFALGAVIMRSVGCTINDIVDRDIDAHVQRTRTRPLPSGQLSLRQALIFLSVLLGLALLILLQLNTLSILLGAASMGLVIVYPLMKRITWWPQVFLGVTFNWGALLGWTAQTGSLNYPALFLYIGCITWTIGYDTIYAHQDKEDDHRLGLKSTALRLGHHSGYWIAGFYGISVTLWLLAGRAADLSIGFVGGLVVAAIVLFLQLRHWNMHDHHDCLQRFRANRWVGWALLIGLLVDCVVLAA